MLIDAFILGAIQGVTEFLPISSSAHLIIASHFLRFQETPLNTNLFDAILHGGSLAAIILFFLKDIKATLSNRKLSLMLCLSALPTFAVGFAVEPFKDGYLRSLYLCAASLVVFGVYMIVSERVNKENTAPSSLTLKDFMFLGLMQAVALIPGTSRSGITISSAFMLGLKKEKAVEVSFLMGIPVISAAFAYELKKAFSLKGILPFDAAVAGFMSAFVFGLLSLFFLVKFIKSYKFGSFAYYRFFVAFLLIVILWKNS